MSSSLPLVPHTLHGILWFSLYWLGDLPRSVYQSTISFSPVSTIYLLMALQIQPQWDVATSIFSASDKIWGLVKAATVDDVQPAAVYAAEAIGSQLVVDPHLIGKAVDALQGHQSYRMQSIKLQLGFSSGGIPNQMRLSGPATRTFCLVTALRLHLPATEIGNLLYELLVESKTIETTPVSAAQLASLVDSIEGHCVMMQDQQAIAKVAISPIVEALACCGTNGHIRDMFCSMVPDESARIIMAAFRAIRDQEIRRLKITGSRAAIWLASLLYWLCPEDVEIIDAKNNQLVKALSTSPKISLVLDSPREEWTLEYYHEISEISSLIGLGDTDTYERWVYPKTAPKELACAVMGLSEPASKMVGRLCCGLVQTAFSQGIIMRNLEDRDEDGSQSIPFRDICTEDFRQRVGRVLVDYGWPLSTIDFECADLIEEYMSSHPCDFSSQTHASYAIALDRAIGGKLFEGLSTDFGDSGLVEKAMCVAEQVILRATHQKATEFETVYGGYGESEAAGKFLVLAPLLSKGRTLSASFFLRQSLACQYTAFGVRDRDTKPSPVVAICGKGHVSYCRGLVSSPRNPAEAFEIITQPGTLKWRDVRHRCLYESIDFPTFTSSPKLGVYQVSENLNTLRIYHSRKPQFSIQRRQNETSIQLHCSEPSTGDRVARLSNALINWALARRVERTAQSRENLASQCHSLGVTQLRLKAPGWDGIGNDPDYPHKIRAIASYSDDEMADLLRFGTFDVDHLHCLIQGMASIYECICVAVREFGDRWIIMATP